MDFFVFKQKTEYEMRISDWSSDVCSSDLLGLDTAKTNIDGGAIAMGHPLGATGARIVGKAASLLKREGGKYALATQCIGGGQGIAKIGRASCRERVCPYGSISVVAVSVKKNTLISKLHNDHIKSST